MSSTLNICSSNINPETSDIKTLTGYMSKGFNAVTSSGLFSQCVCVLLLQ